MRTSLASLTAILMGLALMICIEATSVRSLKSCKANHNPKPIEIEEPDLECRKNGCIGDICSDEQVDYMCAARDLDAPPENTCWLQSFAICERQASGECGWTYNDELNECNADYDAFVADWVAPKPIEPIPIVIEEPKLPCMKSGCIGDVCTDEHVDYMCAAPSIDDPPQNTCWMQSYAICERQKDDKCGWTYNDELDKCNADYDALVASWVPPKPVKPVPVVVEEPKLPCMKSGCISDVCTDQQIHYTCAAPSSNTPPESTCWKQSFAICERQADGKCGWTSNDKLKKCNADHTKLVANWVPPKAADDEDSDIDLDLGFDY